MRSLAHRLVPIVLALILPMLGAGTSSAVPAKLVPVARQRALAADAAREARMEGRAISPARPVASREASATIFQTPEFVRQVARDTLKGGERDTQIEPDIAMDPNRPKDLVAVFQQGRFRSGGSVDPGFATSLDGGKTWIHGNLPGLTTAVGGPFDRSSDPTVIFGPDHTAYATTISFDQNDCRSAVSVQSSGDGGRTWSEPVFPQDDTDCGIFHDKNWLGVDTTPASPFFGRLYLVWSLFTPASSPAVLRYSDDDGATWSDLIYVSAPDVNSEGLLPLVQSNGDLTIVYDETIGAQDFEVAQTSSDGGDTFGAPATISEFLGASDPGLRTGGLPAAAIDPTTDDEYVVWQDTRFRSDGRNDVVISASINGGGTWSSLSRVNLADPAGTVLDHFTPDVAAHGGVVHVTYRTRDLSGAKPSDLVDERYIVSADGGASFGGELVLGPSSDLRYAARVGGGRAFLGDYMGVVANGGVAHAVWCVSRPGTGRFTQRTWSGAVLR